jgi:hypothetical protein
MAQENPPIKKEPHPKAKEFLTDPKYQEQRDVFKDIIAGLQPEPEKEQEFDLVAWIFGGSK